MSRVLPYLGGKSQVAPEIISRFPKGPKTYVEPFFGGGGVFFTLPPGTYTTRVANDINHNVVTFFRVLRSRVEELEHVCSLTPYAKQEWSDCGQLSTGLDITKPDDEPELARRLWVRQSQGFAGRQEGGSPCWARKGAKGPDLAGRAVKSIDMFQEASDWLSGVEVDCLDALEFIGKYAGPDCFIYEDPPYVPETRVGKSYDHEPDEKWHKELCELNLACSEAGSLIALSGYDNDIYNDILKGWRKESFERYAPSAMGATEKRRMEVLWMNYPASVELGDRWKQPVLKAKSKNDQALLSKIKARGKRDSIKNH